MKINNKKEIAIAMYGFFLLILVDLVFLVFAKKIFVISNLYLYGSFFSLLLFCIWKIVTLKIFSLEVSEHIFSIKYTHPLVKSRQPALEVPLQKVVSVKTEKGVMNYIMVIGINSRRGIRNFYYRLGRLPENQNDKFQKISEFIASARTQPEVA